MKGQGHQKTTEKIFFLPVALLCAYTVNCKPCTITQCNACTCANLHGTN